MADVTVIGRGAHVTGRMTGAVDLEIHGRVDGDVAVDGEVTIETEGLVGANVGARRLVVRGAVKGDLTGEEAVLLEKGARVVGDIRAPRVAISPGALVRGYVETGQAGAASRRRAPATARPPAQTHAPTKPKIVPRSDGASARKAPPPASLLAGNRPKGPPSPV